MLPRGFDAIDTAKRGESARRCNTLGLRFTPPAIERVPRTSSVGAQSAARRPESVAACTLRDKDKGVSATHVSNESAAGDREQENTPQSSELLSRFETPT